MSGTTDEISIVIGSVKIIGWETVNITRSVESFPNSFVLTASDQFPGDPARATVPIEGPGQVCQVFIGGDLVITGFVDRYTISVGPRQHIVTISGRGICQDLADCSADLAETPDLLGATISATDTLDLAQKLCKPFKLNARLAVADHGKPVKQLTIQLGETAYEIIERVARYAGYLVYEDELGALVLDRVGTQQMASGFSMPGNIEGAVSSLSIDQRFSRYTVVWQSVAQYGEINPLGNQRADVIDPTMANRYRPRIIVSEQIDPDADYATARANWELARRIGRSQAVQLTCDSWRDAAGQLWQPNYLAPIDAPALKIGNKVYGPTVKPGGLLWIIGTVTFRRDQSGTHADITLMPPDAFNPEPAPLFLWDRQFTHDLAANNAASPGMLGHV